MKVLLIVGWFGNTWGYFVETYEIPTMELCEEIKHRLEFSTSSIKPGMFFIGGSCVEKKE